MEKEKIYCDCCGEELFVEHGGTYCINKKCKKSPFYERK